MSTYTTWRFHPVRAAQLNRVAQAERVPLSNFLGLLACRAVQAGLIPDELPGFEVCTIPNAIGGLDVRMNIDGVALPDMDAVLAKMLSLELTKVIRSRGSNQHWSCPITMECVLRVERRGRGIVLMRSDTGTAGSLPGDLALDLARHLWREGNAAQAHGEALAA